MPDNPTRNDAPKAGTASGLTEQRVSPEVQKKIDDFRALRAEESPATEASGGGPGKRPPRPPGAGPSDSGLYPNGPGDPDGLGALGHLWEKPKDLKQSAEFLPPGTQIDRYGRPDGEFYAPSGTPISDRTLRPGTNTDQVSARWEILKPLPPDSFSQSVVASYYQERDGGGMQYRFHTPLSELERGGYVRPVSE
ncbi:TNT domain-containing protein [Actinoplanes sp. CA-030573]|uniref:TNT domain-containing protein n=1 Tax=Actinoplanes sp. CA-030573 TaxID=3239898 RepID=UPI003D92D35A